jgi:transcription initiation factor TFIID subunit 5
MSKSGFGLLLGWLTDGNLGAGGIWVDGGRVGRGRAAVMRVVNDHLEFEGSIRLY